MSLVANVSAIGDQGEFAVEIQVAIRLDLDIPDNCFSEAGILDLENIVGGVDVKRTAAKDPGKSGLREDCWA